MSSFESSPTAVSDDAVIGVDVETIFQRAQQKFNETRSEIERVLSAVDVYTNSLRVTAAKSLAASEAITSFYGETDGRLGSSAVVHLRAIDEPFRNQCLAYISKLQLASYNAREQYAKIFVAFENRVAMRNRTFKEFSDQQKRWKKSKVVGSDKKRSADLTGSLVRFQVYNHELVEDMRLFCEQRHDPFDTLLMALLNVRFATDGLSEFDIAQKRTLNDEYQMKLLALKLPLTASAAQITASLASALANHYGYQYFKRFLSARNRVEDLNFWESVRLRREIRREAVRQAEAQYIYERYFGAQADPGVDITQRALARLLRRRDVDSSISSLFDEAQAEVYARLELLFVAFLQSPEYDQLLDRLTFASFHVNDNANELLDLAKADDDGDKSSPLLVPRERVPSLHFGTATPTRSSVRTSSNNSNNNSNLNDGDPQSGNSSTSSSPQRTASGPFHTPDAAEIARWKREQETQLGELTRALKTHSHDGADRVAALSRRQVPASRPMWQASSEHTTDEFAADLPALSRESIVDIVNVGNLPPLPPRPDEHVPMDDKRKRLSAMARPSLSPRANDEALNLALIDAHGDVVASASTSRVRSPRNSRHSSASPAVGASSPRHSHHHHSSSTTAAATTAAAASTAGSPRHHSHHLSSSGRRARSSTAGAAMSPRSPRARAASPRSPRSPRVRALSPHSPRSPRSSHARASSPRRHSAKLSSSTPTDHNVGSNLSASARAPPVSMLSEPTDATQQTPWSSSGDSQPHTPHVRDDVVAPMRSPGRRAMTLAPSPRDEQVIVMKEEQVRKFLQSE